MRNNSVYFIVILALVSVQGFETPQNPQSKQEYLKGLQSSSSDFSCLKKCVRTPVSQFVQEPTVLEADPRPQATSCSDRPVSEVCKSLFAATATLVQIDEAKMYVHTTAMTWHAAWRTCRTMGLQLASLVSQNVIKKLGDYLAGAKIVSPLWTSGYIMNSGEALWIETGAPVLSQYLSMTLKRQQNTCITVTSDGKTIRGNEDLCSKTNQFLCEVPDECFTHLCSAA